MVNSGFGAWGLRKTELFGRKTYFSLFFEKVMNREPGKVHGAGQTVSRFRGL